MQMLVTTGLSRTGSLCSGWRSEVSVDDGTVVVVKKVTAGKAHRVPDRPPLRLAVGDEVQAGDRDTEWPEFAFVTAGRGCGWVPARHLSQPVGQATVLTAYDTTELTTRVDDVLDVIAEDRISGWLWCRSSTNQQGWVPINTVNEEEDSPT